MKTTSEGFFFEGDERAVILFHAFTSSATDNRALGRALNKEGYTVYGPTFTNHVPNRIEATLEVEPKTWFEDGQKAVDKLKAEGYKDISVAGVSLGGIVSTYLLINNPDLKSAGTFCSPMVAGYDTNTPNEFWDRYVNEKTADGLSNVAIEASREEIEKGVKIVLDYLDDLKQEMSASYSNIKSNFFVAQGGDDQTIDPMQAFEFASQLRHTDVDFNWYKDAGHVIMNGPERKKLVRDYSTFLSKI